MQQDPPASLAYDVQGTAAWIRELGLRKVALQLPDEMLPRAALLVHLIRQELSTAAAKSAPELFVLADSSVSEWDPDVIAAQHVGADGLVMYGRASVCRTSAFPVRHVFGREALRADVLAAEISRCVPADQRLIILPHAVYWDYAGVIRDAVKPVHSNVFVGELRPENSFEHAPAARQGSSCCSGDGQDAEHDDRRGASSQKNQGSPSAGSCIAKRGFGVETGCCTDGCVQMQRCEGGRVDEQDGEDCLRMGNYVVAGVRSPGAAGAAEGDEPTVVVYIGEEGPELTRLMLENAGFRFLLFKATGQDEGGGMVRGDALTDSVRALKRRYYLMMKTKDAERVGIVVATTAVEGYRAMVQRLKTIIRAAGKRPYVFYVGKLNPAKLANFPEMDALVLVASPETCAAVDTGEYWKPLITPMECEIALVKGRTWTGQYDFDFRPLLATALPEAPLRSGNGGDSDQEEEEISHSLTAGTLTVRSAGTMMALSAGEVMMTTRTFRGLDLSEGLDRSLDLVQGRVGIASGYSHEPSATSNQLHHTCMTDGTTVPAHMLGHASAVNYVVAGTEEGRARGDGVIGECHLKEGRSATTASLVGGADVSANDDMDMLRVADQVDDFFALLAS